MNINKPSFLKEVLKSIFVVTVASVVSTSIIYLLGTAFNMVMSYYNPEFKPFDTFNTFMMGTLICVILSFLISYIYTIASENYDTKLKKFKEGIK